MTIKVRSSISRAGFVQSNHPLSQTDMDNNFIHLDTADVTEASTARSAEASLHTALSNEIVTRSTTVSAEASTARSAEGSLSARVSTESSTRASADASLATLINTLTSSETATRSTSLSTEVSARISGDASLATVLNAEVLARSTAVSSEASTARSAELSLHTSLSTESSKRVALSTSLSAETSARISADASLTSSLSTSISSEAHSRSAAISSEASTARSAETAISSALSTELITRSAAVSSVATAVASEITARSSAVAGVSSSLSSETAARISGDTSVATALSNFANRTAGFATANQGWKADAFVFINYDDIHAANFAAGRLPILSVGQSFFAKYGNTYGVLKATFVNNWSNGTNWTAEQQNFADAMRLDVGEVTNAAAGQNYELVAKMDSASTLSGATLNDSGAAATNVLWSSNKIQTYVSNLPASPIYLFNSAAPVNQAIAADVSIFPNLTIEGSVEFLIDFTLTFMGNSLRDYVFTLYADSTIINQFCYFDAADNTGPYAPRTLSAKHIHYFTAPSTVITLTCNYAITTAASPYKSFLMAHAVQRIY